MLDTVLNDGVLKDLPILGAIVGVGKSMTFDLPRS